MIWTSSLVSHTWIVFCTWSGQVPNHMCDYEIEPTLSFLKSCLLLPWVRMPSMLRFKWFITTLRLWHQRQRMFYNSVMKCVCVRLYDSRETFNQLQCSFTVCGAGSDSSTAVAVEMNTNRRSQQELSLWSNDLSVAPALFSQPLSLTCEVQFLLCLLKTQQSVFWTHEGTLFSHELFTKQQTSICLIQDFPSFCAPLYCTSYPRLVALLCVYSSVLFVQSIMVLLFVLSQLHLKALMQSCGLHSSMGKASLIAIRHWHRQIKIWPKNN